MGRARAFLDLAEGVRLHLEILLHLADGRRGRRRRHGLAASSAAAAAAARRRLRVVGGIGRRCGFGGLSTPMSVTIDFFTWAGVRMGFHGARKASEIASRGLPLRKIIGPCRFHLGPLHISFCSEVRMGSLGAPSLN